MSVLPRIIPVVQVMNGSIVKTSRFRSPKYIGHPSNTVRMFNELQVDEIVVIDLGPRFSPKYSRDWKTLESMSEEAFVPITIGGGVKSVDEARTLVNFGYEKIIFGGSARSNPTILEEASGVLGTQAVIVAIDVVAALDDWRCVEPGRHNAKTSLSELLLKLSGHSFGELLLTSVEREGQRCGLDVGLIRRVSREFPGIPLIAHGGAGNLTHAFEGLEAGASAVGLGDAFVRMGTWASVLVHFPMKAKGGEGNT